MRDVAALLPRVIGPFARHCGGCPFHPEAAYVTTPLIGLGMAAWDRAQGGSRVVAQTLAFDRAESETANLTQTNMVSVSSFNGVQGLLLGYDLLRQPLTPHPLLPDSPGVYDAAPLFAATRALYGTVAAKRFPVHPGQHLLCAAKTHYAQGPALLYGAIGIGIAHERALDADLFLEDVGALPDLPANLLAQATDLERAQERQRVEAVVLSRLVDAIEAIGDNLGVRYAHCFVGLRARFVPEGEVGCALVAVPYVHLARASVPAGGIATLAALSCQQWEDSVRAEFPAPSASVSPASSSSSASSPSASSALPASPRVPAFPS